MRGGLDSSLAKRGRRTTRSVVEGAQAVKNIPVALGDASSPAPLPPQERSPLPAVAGRDAIRGGGVICSLSRMRERAGVRARAARLRAGAVPLHNLR